MKVAAISWLRVDPATRPGFVLLTHDWVIHLADGRWVLVRAGFWCDGASIPAVARPWLSPLTLIALGVAHDYAVRSGAAIQRPSGGDADPFDVATATALAIALAERAGIGRVKRRLIGAALRVTARSYWHRRAMDWTP